MKVFYLLLMAILLGTYWAVLSRVKRSSSGPTPLLGWLMGLAYFMLVPLTTLTISGGYELPPSDGITEEWGKMNFGNPVFLRPFLFIWISMMLTCAVVWFFVPKSLPPEAEDSVVSRRRLQSILLVLIALSLVDWAIQIWLAGGLSDFLVSHWYLRSDEMSKRFGDSFTLYTRISLALQLLFTGAAVLYTSLGLKKRSVSWPFTSLVLVALLLEMVMSGNRIFIAFYLLGFLTCCWLYGRKKLIALLLIASPMLVLIFSVWGLVRHDLSTIPDAVSSGIIETEIRERALSSLMYATEGQGVLLLVHVINDFPNRFDFLYGSTYGRLFTFWMPRSMYPQRPLDFTNQAAVFYLPGETTSLCATALGEAYANFGFPSMFVLPFFSWGVIQYTNYLSRGGRRTLMSAVSFVVLIWFARCTFAENVFNLVAVALLIWVFRFEKRLRTSPSPLPPQIPVAVRS